MNIIKSIVRDLSADLNQKELLSFSLVGSFSDPNKAIEYSNDLDFVLVYDKINPALLSQLKSSAERIRAKYSSDSLKVDYTFKIGPIKLPEHSKNILIHFLVYSKESYLEYSSKLTRYSFLHYPALSGVALKDLDNLRSISIKDLFNEIDGIPAIKNRILKKQVSYIIPTNNGFKVTTQKLSDQLYIEVLFHSVLWLANNMLRVLDGYYADLSEAMCKKFNELIPISMNSFPLKIYNIKKDFRKNAKLTKLESAGLALEAEKFIEECEAYLNKLF